MGQSQSTKLCAYTVVCPTEKVNSSMVRPISVDLTIQTYEIALKENFFPKLGIGGSLGPPPSLCLPLMTNSG